MSLLPSKQDGIISRTDYFIKVVLRNYKIDILKKRDVHNRYNIYYADLDNEQYKVKEDNKEFDVLRLWIRLDHFLVSIENELLYEAMLMLTRKRLKIILYSYFENLTDKEISEIMLIPKSTVHRHRIAALHNMRESIEKGMVEK